MPRSGRVRRLLAAAGHVIETSALILAVAGAARADNILINNGLAPPNPDNVIDDGTYSGDDVYVRNVGCPPGWPAGFPDAPCPSPGAATQVELMSGGAVHDLSAHDSSSVSIYGGSVYRLRTHGSSSLMMSGGGFYDIWAQDQSTVTVSGGSMGNAIIAGGSSTVTVSGGMGFETDLGASDFASFNVSGGRWNQLNTSGSSMVTMTGGGLASVSAAGASTVRMSGGAVDTLLTAADSSLIELIGINFIVDGMPVLYGDLVALTGTLTGTLASGDTLSSVFFQGGYSGSYTGTIRLIPEPSTALLLALGLVGLGRVGRRP